MPRSDGGRAAARGWSAGGARKRHSGASCRVSEFWARNASLELSLDRRSHHPGAGRSSAGPSSAEEGNKMPNLHIPAPAYDPPG